MRSAPERDGPSLVAVRREAALSDKFTILIATIDGDDANRTYTYAVGRAFVNREGIEQIETCRVLRVAGFSDEARRGDGRGGPAWLQQQRADLLIGGRLLKKDEAVDLWFIGNGGGQGFPAEKIQPRRQSAQGGFREGGLGPIAGRRPGRRQPGYGTTREIPGRNPETGHDRLRYLLQDTAGFSAKQRAQLHHALGLGLWVIGEQSGDKKALVEALAAYRAALTEWTRERVPLQWAQTQNNLGNVLCRLGERESGTPRLEEAVAAFRAALSEWTRERVPLAVGDDAEQSRQRAGSLGERRAARRGSKRRSPPIARR